MVTSLKNYRTTACGIAAAVLTYLIQQHIGNVGIEQALLPIAIALGGISASDAAKRG